jgi:hypothetical protein
MTDGLGGDVVEVGCWEGRSTVALARAVFPADVIAVDTWEGSPGEESFDLAHTDGRDVYATFLHNVGELTAGNVQPFQMSWEEFFTNVPGPIRFLHIDAEHTYDQVTGNIRAALPHMVDGAIMCGDDAHHPPVLAAVYDIFGAENVTRTATLWWVQL